MLNFGYIYSADISESFSSDTDYLPVLREEIEEANASFIPETRQASIYSVIMTSASVFSVNFLLGVASVPAELMPNGVYKLEYCGGFEQIVFDESTTLTGFRIDWFPDAKNWKTVTFEVPEGSTLMVSSPFHPDIYYTPDVNDKYYLKQGNYILTLIDSESNVTTQEVLVVGSGDYKASEPQGGGGGGGDTKESPVVGIGQVGYMILGNVPM